MNIITLFIYFQLTIHKYIPFQLLHEQWASYSAFYKYQPIGLVRYANKYVLHLNVLET